MILYILTLLFGIFVGAYLSDKRTRFLVHRLLRKIYKVIDPKARKMRKLQKHWESQTRGRG